MWKHWGLFLPFAAILLSGCSGAAGESPDEKSRLLYEEPRYEWGAAEGGSLTLWSMEPDMERVYMKRAIENYQAATGGHIEVIQLPKLEFEEKLVAALAGEGEAPDLIFSYGGANIDAFDPDDNFYDFTDAQWVEDLTDTAINQTIYHGKVIGLPHWEASISGTIYNKEIFERLHISIPESQEEYLAACEELLQHGVTPVYMPFDGASMMLYQFPLDSIVKNSEILRGLNEGTVSYADLPQMEQIVDWYKIMAERGYFGENYLENDWDGMNDAMKSGRYAMMICWDTWLYTDFDGDADQFGLMPAFMGIPDGGTFEGPNLGLVIVNRNSGKLDEALNFVTFLADPYNYNRVFEGIYTAPVFKHQVSSISTPQYAEAERLIEENFNDSIAWLRIKGFSQLDASCIIDYMTGKISSAKECLLKMDRLRRQRIAQ